MAGKALVSIELKGDKTIARALDAMRKAAVEPRAVLLPMGAYMQQRTAQNFIAKRDPITGAPWAPRAPLTSSLTTNPNTLQQQSHLFRSVVNATPRVTKDSVSIGSALPYAAIHQRGGTILPKRAKNLAVPLTKAAKRAGSARRWWAQQEAKGKKPFILPTRTGKKIIALAEGAGKARKVTAVWLLVPSMHVIARPYIGFDNAGQDAAAFLGIITKATRLAVERAAAQGGGA